MVAAVALFAAASCNKELPQENLPTVGETVVYTASTDGADTKAVLNETTKKSEWVENDAITVHDGEKNWTFTTAEAGANVDFSNSEGFGEYRPVLAVYPAGTYTVDVNDKTVNAYILTYQPARKGTYNEGAALAVAYSENDQFAFKNAHALIKFTIKGSNIKAVEFYGNNSEAITGNMLVSLNEDNTIKSVVGQDTVFEEGKDNEWTGKGTWVKIYSEDEANGWCFEDGATYYAAVAPADFTKGVSINYILADDTKIDGAKKTENRVNLTASTILNIGDLEYVAPVVEHSGWSLPGGYNGWNTANTFLYEEGDYYVAKNVSGLNSGFKFQHPEFGWKGVGSTDPVTVGEWHKLNGESNISLADDKAYDIYMTKDGSQFQAVVAGSAAPEAPVVVADYWGLIGSMAGSAWGTDLVLTEEGDYLVYKGVTLTTSDEFKFRKNGLWDNQKIAKGALAAANTEYDLVDAGSSNMKVSTAGTYDIYVKKDISKVYFMTAGKTPEDAIVSKPEPEPETRIIYLDVQNCWKEAGAVFMAHFWGGESSLPSPVMMTSSGTDLYQCDVPSDATDIIFVRKNPNNASADWSGEWNRVQTELSIEYNLFTITDWGAGSWSAKLPTFPVTLVEGDNGEMGRLLYQYLVEKYTDTSKWYDLEEEVYAPHYDDTERATWVCTSVQEWGKNPKGYGITFYFTAHSGAALSEDGICKFHTTEKQ